MVVKIILKKNKVGWVDSGRKLLYYYYLFNIFSLKERASSVFFTSIYILHVRDFSLYKHLLR